MSFHYDWHLLPYMAPQYYFSVVPLAVPTFICAALEFTAYTVSGYKFQV